MARRHRSHKGVITFFVAVAIILALGSYFYFFNPFEESMLPLKDQCYVVSSGTLQNSFPCDGGKCDVRVSDFCNSKSPDTSVVSFRTNLLAKDLTSAGWSVTGKWIAYDVTGDGTLECFSQNTNNLGANKKFTSYVQTPAVVGGYRWNSDYSYIFVSNDPLFKTNYGVLSIGANKQLAFLSGSGCDLTSTTKEPYKTNGQEMYSGTTSSYQCSKDIYVDGKLLTTITYSNKDAGKYESAVIHLNKGQKLESSGADIEWAVVDDSKACSASKCNDQKTGYYACSTGTCPTLSSTLVKCGSGEYCTQSGSGGAAMCGAPFETHGEVISGRTAGEPITFEYLISSPTVSLVTITYRLININDRSKNLDISSNNAVSLPTSKKTITFAGQGIGSYEIIVEKTYSGATVANEVYPFVIGSALTTQVFVPQSPLTGTNLIVGSPFYVDAQALEGAIVVTELSEFDVKATLLDVNNVVKTLTVSPGQIKSTQTGSVMRYTFIVTEPGKFTFEAAAKKYGVPSDKKSRTADVKPSKISISFTNIAHLVNMQPGEQTVTFETTDPMEQLIDVDYHVELIPSGAAQGTEDIDVTSSVKKQTGLDNTGKYEFTYNFQTGTYIIEVSKVTATGYSIESVAKSPSINVDPTATVKECISSEECSAGKVCIDNTCVDKEPPYMLYFLIIGISVIVIVLIVVIVKMARRKKAPQVPMMPGM